MSDLDNFRQETKEWLEKNCPPTMRSGAPSNAPVDEVWGGKKAKYKNPESKIWIEWVRLDNAYSAQKIWRWWPF